MDTPRFPRPHYPNRTHVATLPAPVAEEGVETFDATYNRFADVVIARSAEEWERKLQEAK